MESQRKLRNPIHKLPSGRYQVSFRDNEKRLTRRSFDRLKDAEEFLGTTRAEIRSNTYIAPAKIVTIKEAAKEWIEAKKVTKSIRGGLRKQSTITQWQSQIDRFINPHLGVCKINTLTLSMVERVRDQWKETGLCADSVNKILTTLNSIIDRQIGRTIHFNPITKIERLANARDGERTEDTAEVREDDVYSPDELNELFNAARVGFDRMVLEVFIFSGIRHGELLALQWKDIDFNKQEIFIRRNFDGTVQQPSGDPVFSTPKTKSSIRRVQISKALVHALREWKLKSKPGKFDLVFARQDEHPYLRKRCWESLDLAMKAAEANRLKVNNHEKFKRLTVHSLRHTYASILLQAGTPLTEVAALLGHSNVQITLQVYAHFIPKMRTNTAETLQQLVFTKKDAVEQAV